MKGGPQGPPFGFDGYRRPERASPWDVLGAAAAGDVAALRRLLERDPNL